MTVGLSRPGSGSGALAPFSALDRWAWLCLLAPLPLLLHSVGAPLGEPVSDDYDFLHHALFHAGEWLDGGGSLFYWRPLARQAWYGLMGSLMLRHPAVVAVLQALMVSLAGLLLYRALRPRWPARPAAVAALFPFTMESARQLFATSTNVQDLGAVLLVAAALYEASRRRMATALAALLGSLLCKEMAVVAAPLLAWMPPSRPEDRGRRLTWTIAPLVLVGVWGASYAAVAQRAQLMFARELFTEANVLATPWPARYLWAIGQSAGDALSLSAVPVPWRWVLLIAALGMIAFTLGAAVARAEVRAQLKAQWPWIASGLLWFLAVTAALADLYPEWRSYRSTFGLIGLGVAGSALLATAHQALPLGLLVLKLAALALSPPPPLAIEVVPLSHAAAVTYPELVRVQRFAGLTRQAVLAAFPSLPSGATVGRHFVPRGAMYGFSGDRALQVWYRDTTIRWLPFGDFLADTGAMPATIVQYEQGAARQVALVNPVAMRALVRAGSEERSRRWRDALVTLDVAESLQTDRGADVFFGIAADQRAMALAALGRGVEAEGEALRALRLWPEAAHSRYVLARLWAGAGHYAAAVRQLDTLLLIAPRDSGAALLRRRISAEIERSGRSGR